MTASGTSWSSGTDDQRDRYVNLRADRPDADRWNQTGRGTLGQVRCAHSRRRAQTDTPRPEHDASGSRTAARCRSAHRTLRAAVRRHRERARNAQSARRVAEARRRYRTISRCTARQARRQRIGAIRGADHEDLPDAIADTGRQTRAPPCRRTRRRRWRGVTRCRANRRPRAGLRLIARIKQRGKSS